MITLQSMDRFDYQLSFDQSSIPFDHHFADNELSSNSDKLSSISITTTLHPHHFDPPIHSLFISKIELQSNPQPRNADESIIFAATPSNSRQSAIIRNNNKLASTWLADRFSATIQPAKFGSESRVYWEGIGRDEKLRTEGSELGRFRVEMIIGPARQPPFL